MSRKRSAFATFWSSGKEKILPPCSPTKKRSPARAISSPFLNCNFGKARSILKGCGGGGEPVTGEVVHGTRGARASGRSAFGASAVAGRKGERRAKALR